MNMYKLDDRVKIIGRNICGKIAYIGETHFSEGEWFGIILDEAKGRNNGCIDGERYFKCSRNYGIFVRACQLERGATEQNGEHALNSNKPNYPNYLSTRNVKPNKYSEKVDTKDVKPKKPIVTKQLSHPMTCIIEDLESSLMKKKEELAEANAQMKTLEEKMKGTEERLEEIVNIFNDSLKLTQDLKEQLSTKQKQILSLKKRQWKMEKKTEISERKRRQLEIIMDELRDITENAVIEKEIAEEKSEDFEFLLRDEKEKRKQLELEMEIMKEEMQIQSSDGVPVIHYVKKLESENMVLTSALHRLKELYSELKQQHLEAQNVAEVNSDEIQILKETEKALTNSIFKYKKEVDELYETVDSVLDADEIVSDVVDRNLACEEKIINLRQELEEAEERLEVSEQVEETLEEIKTLCRDKIEHLESEIRYLKMSLDQKSKILELRDDTIIKFRELTKVLHEKNVQIYEDYEIAVQERKDAVMAAESLKLKVSQESEKQFKDVIEMEILKINYESMTEQLKCWTSFMPENFFEEEGENIAIQVKVTVLKMEKNALLLIKNLSALIDDKAMIAKELPFINTGSKILIVLYDLWCLLKISYMSFDRADVGIFLSSGKIYAVLTQNDTKMEEYLKYLYKGEIDSEHHLCNLKSLYNLLCQILNVKFAPEFEKTMICSETYACIIRITCKCIASYCSVLCTFDKLANEGKIKLKDIAKVANDLNTFSCSVSKFISSCKGDNLIFLPVVAEKLKKYANAAREGMDVLIPTYIPLVDNITELTAYKPEQDAEISHIMLQLEEASKEFSELCHALHSGDFVTDMPNYSQYVSPLHIWAQLKKQEKQDALNNLRTKITSCELEIIILTETLKMKSVKENCNLKNVFQQTVEMGDPVLSKPAYDSAGDTSMNDLSSSVQFLSLKLHDMESAMKFLRQRNFELNMAFINYHQSSLPPLEMPLKPRYHPDVHHICVLQKKLNEVAKRLRSILVPMVVDITPNIRCKETKYKRYLTERMLVKNEIKEQIWSIGVEIRNIKHAPKSVWSNTMPSHLRKIEDVSC